MNHQEKKTDGKRVLKNTIILAIVLIVIVVIFKIIMLSNGVSGLNELNKSVEEEYGVVETMESTDVKLPVELTYFQNTLNDNVKGIGAQLNGNAVQLSTFPYNLELTVEDYETMKLEKVHTYQTDNKQLLILELSNVDKSIEKKITKEMDRVEKIKDKANAVRYIFNQGILLGEYNYLMENRKDNTVFVIVK